MLEKVELIAILNKQTPLNEAVAYLLGKESKILLTLELGNAEQRGLQTSIELKLLLGSLELRPILVELGISYQESCVSTINKENQLVKIAVKKETAITFAQYFELPIFIQKENLLRDGVMITKKFIEEILLC